MPIFRWTISPVAFFMNHPLVFVSRYLFLSLRVMYFPFLCLSEASADLTFFQRQIFYQFQIPSLGFLENFRHYISKFLFSKIVNWKGIFLWKTKPKKWSDLLLSIATYCGFHHYSLWGDFSSRSFMFIENMPDFSPIFQKI